MVGITAYGAYIPIYRMKRATIARAWGKPPIPGEKAVANYDEDCITMATEAVLDCLQGTTPGGIDALFCATTSSPYLEKQTASLVAKAVDLPETTRTEDFTASLRAGSTALISALDAVTAGSRSQVAVAASDCRQGNAKSLSELELGDAAAAVVLGRTGVLAAVEDVESAYDETLSIWRSQSDIAVRSAEDRFVADRFLRVASKTILSLLERNHLTPADIDRAVYNAPDGRTHAGLVRALGLKPGDQVDNSLLATVGNTGASSSLLMLVQALEEAEPGQLILLANYGDGCDALLLRTTDEIKNLSPRRGVREHLASSRELTSYERFASWRGLIHEEPPSRPAPPTPSATCLWRESKGILSLYGVRCRHCGTVQYPTQRVCVNCRTKDDFEDYRFADKKGRVFTYGIDYLTASKDPPATFAIVDFQGGGRISCEITDSDPDQMAIDLPVEMSFRRLYEAGGIYNYFWKARPTRQR